MLETSQHMCLAFETSDSFRLFPSIQSALAHLLDCYKAVAQFDIGGLVDRAHASPTRQTHNAITVL
jgi:hypothetical protein